VNHLALGLEHWSLCGPNVVEVQDDERCGDDLPDAQGVQAAALLARPTRVAVYRAPYRAGRIRRLTSNSRRPVDAVALTIN
jgi:hypothetical protein